jgi:hypothetical protein
MLAVLLLAPLGCQRPNPAWVGLADAAAHDAAPPSDDAPPLDDGGVPPAACTAGESTCVGGLLVDCDGAGQWVTHDPPCDSLCTKDTETPPLSAHCGGFEPSNGLPRCGTVTGHGPFPGTPSGTPIIIDTDAATINGSSYGTIVVPQPDGPDITVFKFRRIDIPYGARVVAVGHNALALYAETDVVIAGAVRAGAGPVATPDQSAGPPAGAWFPTAPWPGGAGPGVVGMSGGGGGGYAQAGGGGGAGISVPPVAGGGVAYGDPSLVPLLGGSPGGPASIQAGTASPPAGGGAVMIVGCRSLVIATTGVVSANGAGGPGGAAGLGERGGQGGGSGGAVLLESPTIDVAGTVTAHGGGGGGGGAGNAAGSGGADGREDLAPALGGTAATGAGAGGAGGIDPAVAAAPGGDAASATEGGGGGGGGGLGRLRFNVLPGTHPGLSSAVAVSPLTDASVGELVLW